MKCIQICERNNTINSILLKWQSDININLRQKKIVIFNRRDSILDFSLHLIIIIITQVCLKSRYLTGNVTDMRLTTYLRNT